MSRGDQRDRDRAKNQAKQQAKAKAQGKGGDPLQRNASDAAALQAKVEAKKAKQSEPPGSPGASGIPIAPKKADNKAKESLDDMLSAGLDAGKKKRAN